MKGAGLHPSVFFFIITIVFHLGLPDPPLTSDKMAKSCAFLLHHSSSSSSSSSKIILSHHIPSHDQKGAPCCTDTLFLSKNLNAGPLALHETGHVY